MRSIAIAFVRLYQLSVRPLLPANTCKYHPSCSQYAIDALREFGFFRGSVLAGWRLLRCNPWSHGGVDYVADQRLFHPPGRRFQTHGQAKPPRADGRHRNRRRRTQQRLFKARPT